MKKIRSYFNKESNIIFTLVILFILSAVLRSILGILFGQMNVYYDELLHWNLSKSVHYHLGNMFRNDMLNYKETLYSTVLSICHSFGNTQMQYYVAVGINSILMSSVIFPVYFMAKKFLNNKNQAAVIAFISIIIPEMSYTAKVIQENLYYPLAIWFFYIFIVLILKDPYRKRNIVLLSVYVFLVSLCKQMALNIFAGVVLYYLLQFFFFDKEKRKKCAIALTWFIAAFIGLKLVYGFWFNFINGITAVSSSEVTIEAILMNLLDPYLLSQLIYPVVTYILFSTLYFGFFTILLPFAMIKELNEMERNLFIITGSILVSSILVICLRIVPAENLDELILRFHFRYLFFLVVPLLILFFSIKDKIAGGRHNKITAVLSLIFVLALNEINILPEAGAKIDCAGANYVKYLFDTEMMQKTLRILILAGIASGLYLLYKKKIKLFYSFLIIAFVVSGVVSSCYMYSELYKNKRDAEAKREDAFTVNSYLNDTIQEDKSTLLILSKTKFSDGTFEVYLQDPSYYVSKMEDFKKFAAKGTKRSFADLTLYSFNIEFKDESLTYPDYIVSYEPVSIDGYEKVDVTLNKYYMYTRSK